MKHLTFEQIVTLVKRTLLLQLLFLLVMTIFRAALFISFTPTSLSDVPMNEIVAAFWFGMRLDLSILGFAYVLPVLLFIAAAFLKNRIAPIWLQRALFGYFFVVYLLVSLILAADYAYFSYFGEHITLWIFGIFDDDTAALLKIAQKNYNLPLIFAMALGYTASLYLTVRQIICRPLLPAKKSHGIVGQSTLLFILLVATFLAIRGSLGIFPIFHWTKDISGNHFVNLISRNGVFAMAKAIEQYKKSQNADQDFIEAMGFAGHIEDAFKIVTGKKEVDPSDLLASLKETTPKNPLLEKLKPHVVVIMVESFGLPITKYQSESFDILRSLKKHFDEDTLFTHFISAANGTIVSMEPMLLNLTARPGTIPYGQSIYQNSSFPTAAAKVYRKSGYETTFMYGGDLSWRNVGSFFSKQGFDSIEGKAKIASTLHLKREDFHDWGVYDQFLYEYILLKLKRATQPQFIYAMTTNNHPPYELYKGYKPKPLKISPELKKHLRGDIELIRKRLYDYQYALDMAGKFLDAIKNGELAQNTVVVITADNNTIEGVMSYDNFAEESKKIPFYLYLPPAIRPEKIDTSVPGSHKDLMATLYGLTLSDTDYLSVGSSLLDDTRLHCGLNESGIVISKAGAFFAGKPQNDAQSACDRYRRAAIAVTDYIAKSLLKKRQD
ncbi:LTA synthase family protein [Hydrogenimonas cancrithermarum]|uniref:LTA synthase family protein n=1 Tax=Hydrogenimonas cancrithermarum TaxID=2993563 RepID=UPI0025726913|nr:LTA synthase family protein [Hydrogenimonas cancrithermarum]